jgi:TPR repeat protein
MFFYANKLSSGLYDENRKKKSEKYYLIAINKELTEAMFSYANKLLTGLYGEDRKIQKNII